MTEQGSWSPRDIGDGAGAFDEFFAQELLSRFPSPELGRRSDASRLSLGPVELASPVMRLPSTRCSSQAETSASWQCAAPPTTC